MLAEFVLEFDIGFLLEVLSGVWGISLIRLVIVFVLSRTRVVLDQLLH